MRNGQIQPAAVTAGARRFPIKIAVISVFVIVLSAGIFQYAWKGRANSAALPTAEIVELAKKTAPEDRAEWLRLSRMILAAENVHPLADPVEPVSNRGDASRVELGYLLFFDPVLSADGSTSCASCHHPDYGMADGLKKGRGVGARGTGRQREASGRELPRNTPSVFNVAFNPVLFWDGRAGSLEEQALEPIFNENELNSPDAKRLISRLRGIPAYREMFGKSFGFNSRNDGSEITMQNVARAIAAFERKLNVTETAYDHFIKGQDDKLTTEQLRGLVVFFGQGQCAACHIPPQFHDGILSSTGVSVSSEKGSPLDTDPGFGAVIRRQDAFGMFKTPGLRNVSRTAPYMHNGGFNTLEDIVEFYNDGGGRGRGLNVFSQDSKVEKLNLTDRQKKDLISFLKSLDSLAPPPMVPAGVPSGLPPVGR